MSDTDAGAEPAFDAELDARGLLCPLPVLKARKRLGPLEPGAVLRILADDPAARVDVPHFCREQGHDLLHQRDGTGAEILFWVRKRVG
ncbi:sulfurtransferase TusA family protein [Limibaculum sp. M0105]|uniref:Sulfurtransferase TusA family protein n=1 Tax=Thermohalobaculum xanthum TaxID=2753746 RepID=A0A8J7MAD5_9RHOB|nr:sulfurtransferase TusA family protein [Thermohalobaculum xanthum]MBK0400653.1 sulfurtransferase TusA family protein [Thermohalobaculum xanthum]